MSKTPVLNLFSLVSYLTLVHLYLLVCTLLRVLLNIHKTNQTCTRHEKTSLNDCTADSLLIFFLPDNWGVSMRSSLRKIPLQLEPGGVVWEGGSNLRVVRLFPTLPTLLKLKRKDVKTD